MAVWPKGKDNSFLRGESGSATVEMVLWVPVIMALLILITDVSFVFFNRAQMLRILQDGNRAFSVGRIETVEDARDAIEQQLLPLSPQVRVTTSLVDGVIVTAASIPVEDLLAIGSLPYFTAFDVTVSSRHYMEY